jgi:hypothetical protein
MNNELHVALISTLLDDKCPTKKYFLKKIDCILLMINFNDEKFHGTNIWEILHLVSCGDPWTIIFHNPSYDHP